MTHFLLLPHPMFHVTWVWGKEPLISVIRDPFQFGFS